MKRRADPHATRAAVEAVAAWLRDPTAPEPERPAIAAAVRLTTRLLADLAPGASVEVRVPPFAAVQCIEGPRHTRGTPPNVVETQPRIWLLLATGMIGVAAAAADGSLRLSGARAADVGRWFPLVSMDRAGPE